MRIIEKGRVPDKFIRATCRNCDTKFEFTEDEALVTFDRNEKVLKVKCPLPECGKDVWVR